PRGAIAPRTEMRRQDPRRSLSTQEGTQVKLVQTSLIALLTVSLLAAPPASAATTCAATSSADCDLSVSLSGLPSTATRGQTITLTETITGPANQAVTLSNIVRYPNGKQYSSSAAVTLDGGGQYVYRF